MAAKSTYYANGLLNLIFNATTFPNLAINATAGPLTVLEISLHTASPGAGGSQTTNEISYTGYARVPVTRDNTGFTVTANGVVPVDPIAFGECTVIGSPTDVTYFAIGTAHSGTGHLLYFGPVDPVVNVDVGVTPTLNIATQVTET